MKSKTKTKTHIKSVTQKSAYYWKNILMESLVLRVNLFCMYMYMLVFAHMHVRCTPLLWLLNTHTHICEKNIRQNEKMPLFTFTSQKSIIKLIVRRAYDLFSLLSIFLICCALCWIVHWPRKWDLQSWFVFQCCRFPSCIHPHETTDNTIILTFFIQRKRKKTTWNK